MSLQALDERLMWHKPDTRLRGFDRAFTLPGEQIPFRGEHAQRPAVPLRLFLIGDQTGLDGVELCAWITQPGELN